MNIKIYTDGACIGNPGPGGWAAIILIEGAVVKIKDPIEYLKRLEFHDNVKTYEDYYF